MTASEQYYFTIVFIYFGAALIAGWGFHLQYGLTRVVNLAFIVSQAAGAYLAAVTSLGAPTPVGGQVYILGAHLPFPLPLAAGALAGAVIAAAIGAIALPYLRRDFFGIVTLTIAAGLVLFVAEYNPLFNGAAGLADVPLPLAKATGLQGAGEYWLLSGLTAVCIVLCWLVVRAVDRSPLARSLRAVRENGDAASALGISRLRAGMIVLALGGAMAGLSGGLMVDALTAWGTSAWQIYEVFVIVTAIVIGGPGSRRGVVLGTFIVSVVITEGLLFLPPIGAAEGNNAAIQLILVALLQIGFMWWGSNGLLPEPRFRPVVAPEAPPAQAAGGLGSLPIVSSRAAAEGDAGGPVLRIEHASISFGGVRAVDDCSLDLGRGITYLIGPNGAGKTSLAALATGAERGSGRVFLEDAELKGAPHRRALQGLVRTFQLPQEFGHMTVLENLLAAAPRQIGNRVWAALVGPRLWGRQEAHLLARADQVLRWCGLADKANEYAGQLSGGQKKLLELARAMMCEPRFLILDEPMAGVSPPLAAEIAEHLLELRRQGLSFLVIEHEMKWVERLGDEVVAMAEGRIIARGPFERVRGDERVRAAFLGRREVAV